MNLSPLPIQKFFDNAGVPLAGGKLFTYVASTTTKVATYTDSTGGTPNTNPVVLNYRGEANIWLDPTLTYKFVLSPSTDTDPPTNPVWTVDNISAGISYVNLLAIITQSFLGAILYPINAAEIAAGLSNANLNRIYTYGDVRRYLADPTGVSDSSTAWSNAIKANDYVFDGHPTGGSYLFNSTVVITRYPVLIAGSTKTIDTGLGGTIITLATAAGATAAIFQTTAFTRGVRIERIQFTWQTFSTGQMGIRWAEVRSGKVFDCAFIGLSNAATTVVGIRFDGTGTFSGDTTIKDCYFTVLFKGILFRNTSTTVRILNNEFSGNLTIPNAFAIEIGNLGEAANTSFGILIAFNTIEAWTRGIYSTGQEIGQIGNYYETNTANWEWVRGNGNARISNESIGERFTSGGAPIYPSQNDTDACMVLSDGIGDLDRMSLAVYRGFFERGRAVKLGEWATPTYAGGTYTCNNGGTWTVDAGDVTTHQWSYVGKTAKLNLVLVTTATTVASPTQLLVAMPAGTQASKAAGAANAALSIAGVIEVGKWSVAASATVIAISRINGAGFGTVAIEVTVEVEFELV